MAILATTARTSGVAAALAIADAAARRMDKTTSPDAHYSDILYRMVKLRATASAQSRTTKPAWQVRREEREEKQARKLKKQQQYTYYQISPDRQFTSLISAYATALLFSHILHKGISRKITPLLLKAIPTAPPVRLFGVIITSLTLSAAQLTLPLALGLSTRIALTKKIANQKQVGDPHFATDPEGHSTKGIHDAFSVVKYPNNMSPWIILDNEYKTLKKIIKAMGK